MKKINIKDVKIQYNNKNVRILNSYKITDVKYMKTILEEFKKETNFKSKRSLKSWIKEWKSHNRLYKLGLFKNHTMHCDLEEDEKIHRIIAYQILGI